MSNKQYAERGEVVRIREARAIGFAAGNSRGFVRGVVTGIFMGAIMAVAVFHFFGMVL